MSNMDKDLNQVLKSTCSILFVRNVNIFRILVS